MGIAPVDDYVALVEKRDQLLDDGVHRPAGFDHQHDFSRRSELRHELLDAVGTDNLGTAGRTGEELGGPSRGAVEHRHRVAVVVHVQYQVLAHDSQPDQSDVSRGQRASIVRENGI